MPDKLRWERESALAVSSKSVRMRDEAVTLGCQRSKETRNPQRRRTDDSDSWRLVFTAEEDLWMEIEGRT